MKRFHVHVAVAELERSIGFYAQLFGQQPSVRKPDYAKWMLEDPRLNFAISQREHETGIRHLGLQVDSRAELETVAATLHRAEAQVSNEQGTTCCYAQSDKNWVHDPDGVTWETFYSYGSATEYGAGPELETQQAAVEPGNNRCCAPKAADPCCEPRAAGPCCA